MSKIYTFLFLCLTSISFLVLLIPTVSAQTLKECPDPVARTDPPKIYSSERLNAQAKFIINVADNTSFGGKWRMRFDCGLPFNQNEDNANLEPNSKDISRTMKFKSGCEFTAGQHTLIAIGGGNPQCIARYTVLDSDAQCQLELIPSTGLKRDEPIWVSGSNLTKDGQFGVFIDNILIKNQVDTGKGTSGTGFAPIRIDQKYLTLGSHQVNIRKFDFISGKFSSPLCTLTFTVGTKDNPGSVSAVNSGNRPPEPATSSGKIIGVCNDPADKNYDPKNPGIVTAIGCIHTNPAEFAQDLLRFLLGISGGVAFLMMLLGAFQMLTSAGNPDTLRAGRERLTSAVIGLLIVIFSVLLLQIIGFDILRIEGFGR